VEGPCSSLVGKSTKATTSSLRAEMGELLHGPAEKLLKKSHTTGRNIHQGEKIEGEWKDRRPTSDIRFTIIDQP